MRCKQALFLLHERIRGHLFFLLFFLSGSRVAVKAKKGIRIVAFLLFFPFFFPLVGCFLKKVVSYRGRHLFFLIRWARKNEAAFSFSFFFLFRPGGLCTKEGEEMKSSFYPFTACIGKVKEEIEGLLSLLFFPLLPGVSFQIPLF